MAAHGESGRSKEYDVKDSNVELIGTDIDHKVKYASAATEPAWNNGRVGVESGVFIWRIEDFEIKPWPKELYGQFYDGDSFIVLHSYEVGSREGEKKLAHDVFFWLGGRTSQDEAGTAAYKAVELDEFLLGAAVQRREVQQCPSDAFVELFPRLSIRSGGVRSGFRHVEDQPREEDNTLLRVFKHHGSAAHDSMIVVEVEPKWQNLDDQDVFILDKGDKIWVWQGRKCSPMEKAKAAQVVHDMTIAKHVDVEVLSQEESRSRLVVNLLGGEESGARGSFQCTRPVTSKAMSSDTNRPRRLFRLSDASGSLSFSLVGEDDTVTQSSLDSSDVYILDNAGKQIWVWQGLGASLAEKASWLKVAQAYVRQTLDSEAVDLYLTPIAKVLEGRESSAFWKATEGV